MKNMIRGLDNDELSFLEQIEKNKFEQDEIRFKEEDDAVEEYRKAVSYLTSEEQDKKIQEFKKSLWSNSKSSTSSDAKLPSTSKKSQAALLAGVVKRKSESSKSEEPPAKTSKDAPQTIQVLGVLPGISGYGSDSDDSENSSGSVEEDELQGYMLLPRVQRTQPQEGQCASKPQ